MATNHPTAEDLWSYALTFYARSGMQPLCLRLQNEGGIDVLMLIVLSWAAGPGGAALSLPELEALQAHVADWRTRTVLPLRAVRVDLRAPVVGIDRAGTEPFREKVKALELAAERVQLGIMADWLSSRPSATAAPEAHREGLVRLTAAAAPSESEIAELIKAAHLG